VDRSTGSNLIEYLCAELGHQLADDVGSPVIMYADRWGYCPAGATDGHDWRETGGKTLATVRVLLRRPAAPSVTNWALTTSGPNAPSR
jgi:hypothetical protein